MSLPVAVPTTVNPGRSAAPQRRPGRRINWWTPLVALRRVTAHLFTRAWRRLGGKARFRLKILVAILLLLAPLWTLNLAVAFFGRTAVFPLSPYFVREKIAALATYARHWVRCTPRDHEDVDRLVKEATTCRARCWPLLSTSSRTDTPTASHPRGRWVPDSSCPRPASCSGSPIPSTPRRTSTVPRACSRDTCTAFGASASQLPPTMLDRARFMGMCRRTA